MCSTLMRCPFASIVTALPVAGLTFVGSTNSKPTVQPSRSFREPLRNPTACGFSRLWRPLSQLRGSRENSIDSGTRRRRSSGTKSV
jgi:hypothetical protein